MAILTTMNIKILILMTEAVISS